MREHGIAAFLSFARAAFPRYNRAALFRAHSMRVSCTGFCAVAALCASSCAVPLGPGYTVEKQNVEVAFTSSPNPRIDVQAQFQLRNTGNQPLSALEIILPDADLYSVNEARIEWDGAPLAPEVCPDPLGRIARLTFPSPWAVRARRSLQIVYSIARPGPASAQLDFAFDAFFLPAEGWSPVLRPAPGLFGSGGSAPKRWPLAVRIPRAFQVHSTGKLGNTDARGTQKVMRFVQRPDDNYPFVLAGQYAAATERVGHQTIHFWMRNWRGPAVLQSVAQSIARAADAYHAVFGPRTKEERDIWIVECPVNDGCGSTSSLDAPVPPPLKRGSIIANVAFLDADFLNASPSAESLALAAATLLAPSWLGYGRNPGYWEQELPMSELPGFAAEFAREALGGPAARTATIRAALAGIPRAGAAQKSTSESLSREKSLLFFFALEDQFGRDHLHAALRHMVQARRGRGYDLNVLIAALEEETGKTVAPFARLWLKHPGIPEEFRARYGALDAPAATPNPASKETPQ
jgi:hypothetical protein